MAGFSTHSGASECGRRWNTNETSKLNFPGQTNNLEGSLMWKSHARSHAQTH